MVRSMIAGVAGLKAHQSKMDVIGNNIANVNTWGFKGYAYNFKDSMYTNSISSSGGNVAAGAAGGRNASQVGYGSQLSSISNVFEAGAPSPSANPMDCMIDGTGFFLVGNMINGAFTDVASSGLYLSRVGIFRVDENKYLVDDQRSYVYGYAVKENTGIPETPAQKSTKTMEGATASFEKKDDGTYTVDIKGIKYDTTVTNIKKDIEEALKQWAAAATADNANFANCNISFSGLRGAPKFNVDPPTCDVDIKVEAKEAGEYVVGDPTQKYDAAVDAAVAKIGGTLNQDSVIYGKEIDYGVPAQYEKELSTLRIPIDPDTNPPEEYELTSYSIREDGTVIGVDKQNRIVPIGKVAIVSVQNPNGLEKTDGYYYRIGDNAGEVTHEQAGSGPAGSILGSYLEMANVDLANEFSNIITTQRGFQANSKIITVTDEMLQELVNMKR